MLFVMWGCSWLLPKNGDRSMRDISPEEFFTEPLQVRLATAVDRGDATAVDAAVREGADVTAWGKDGYSLLYWAMARNNVAGFEALVKNGADLKGEYRDPALVAATRSRDFIIRLAIEADNPGFLAAALRQGFDPNYVLYKKSMEPLLFLAGHCHSERAIQLLLDAGADIERQDVMGYTALGDAMLRTDFKTMWFLLERGADPMTGQSLGTDISSQLKTYGSRGVRPEHQQYFDKILDALAKRGLLTRQDIIEADKQKKALPEGTRPDITVIEHSPRSEAGRVIRELDHSERKATDQDQ